jgi:hypothetical protein
MLDGANVPSPAEKELQVGQAGGGSSGVGDGQETVAIFVDVGGETMETRFAKVGAVSLL